MSIARRLAVSICAVLVAGVPLVLPGPSVASGSVTGEHTGRVWASISGGAEHTCGIGTDRGVRCWGSAGDGRLGVDGGDRFSPVDIGVDADAVRAGGRHTCVVDGEELRCWGANDDGQLGAEGASGPAPRQVAGSWQAVATGGQHTCAIAGDRTVRCWGANGAGQLGRAGDGSSEPSPVALPCP